MNITITLQADSRLLNAIEQFTNAFSNINAVPASDDQKKKAPMKVVPQQEPAKNNAASQPEPPATTVDEPLDIAKVRQIAAEVSQAGKKEKIKGLLKEMNVARVTDLQEAQWSEFVTKAKAL